MLLDKVKYWSETSDYDLDTADAMFRTGRWLYVGYMCHQSIEKIFKAYWCSTRKEDPPYTHNLIHLAQNSGLTKWLDDDSRNFINTIMPLNIEARYPSYKKAIADAMTEERCQAILTKTKTLQQWVKTKL